MSLDGIFYCVSSPNGIRDCATNYGASVVVCVSALIGIWVVPGRRRGWKVLLSQAVLSVLALGGLLFSVLQTQETLTKEAAQRAEVQALRDQAKALRHEAETQRKRADSQQLERDQHRRWAYGELRSVIREMTEPYFRAVQTPGGVVPTPALALAPPDILSPHARAAVAEAGSRMCSVRPFGLPGMPSPPARTALPECPYRLSADSINYYGAFWEQPFLIAARRTPARINHVLQTYGLYLDPEVAALLSQIRTARFLSGLERLHEERGPGQSPVPHWRKYILESSDYDHFWELIARLDQKTRRP